MGILIFVISIVGALGAGVAIWSMRHTRREVALRAQRRREVEAAEVDARWTGLAIVPGAASQMRPTYKSTAPTARRAAAESRPDKSTAEAQPVIFGMDLGNPVGDSSSSFGGSRASASGSYSGAGGSFDGAGASGDWSSSSSGSSDSSSSSSPDSSSSSDSGSSSSD